MTWTYEPEVSRPLDQVRLLIGDTDLNEPGNWIFQDEEVIAFLAMEDGAVKLAAAQALDTMASQEAMILKAIRLLDLSTDGPKVAAELRARAEVLREQFYGGASDLPQSAELVVDQFTFEERMVNQFLREGG